MLRGILQGENDEMDIERMRCMFINNRQSCQVDVGKPRLAKASVKEDFRKEHISQYCSK